MFCPSCGKQNANTAIYCNSCGKPLPSATAAAPATASAPAPDPAPAPVLSAAPAPAPPPPAPPAAPMYSAPASTPMPYAPAPKNRSGVAVIIVLVLAAAGVGGFLYLRNIDQEAADAHISRLVREATGQQPIKKAFWSKNQKFDDAFRDEFRKLMQLNQDYMTQEKNADMSAVPKLGTPESFADPTLAADGLRQLHTIYDIDMAQEQKVQQIVSELRNFFQTADISESERQEAVRNFDAGIAGPLSKRQVVVSAEQAWIQSVDDAYDYATTNHAVFMMNNGQLLITDNDVLQNFNAKARNMDARRTEFVQKQEAFSKDQVQSIQKLGVSPKDMGMQ